MTVTFDRLKPARDIIGLYFAVGKAHRPRDGIPIPQALIRGLDQVADDLGIAKLGETNETT